MLRHLLGAVLGSLLAAQATATVRPGDSLAQALREFQSRGLPLIWSSQVVRDELTVRSMPRGDTPEQQLRSLLEPLGLELRPSGAGAWVVTQRAASSGPPPPATARTALLDAIVVQTSRYELERPATGARVLARSQIEELPRTDEDVARSLQQLPGSAAGDYSARTHVRGSRDDETVFQFDGVTLHDPFHLKNFQGLFSALDPAATDSVRFWSGDFPIDQGGSIGALAQITPRQPTRPLAEAGVSVLNTSLLLGAPFADGRGSILLSARNSNLSKVAQLLDRDIGDPDFRDLTLRATWNVNDRVQTSAGVLALADSISLSRQDPQQQASAYYRDLYLWARAAYDLPSGLHGETLISDAILDAHRSALVDRPNINVGTLRELRHSSVLTLRQDFTAPVSSRLSLRGGAELTHTAGTANIDSTASFSAPFFPYLQNAAQQDRLLAMTASDRTFAIHGAARWELRPGDVLEAGLRRDAQRVASGSGHSQWNLRMNWWHRFNDRLTLRAAWGQYSQAPNPDQTDLADGIIRTEPVRRAHQTSISLEQRFDPYWLLRIGAYDKRESSALTTFENLFSPLVLTPEIEVDRLPYTSSGATMRGLEFTLQSDPTRTFSGWANYTWSQATERVAGVDMPRSWDQPHALQTGLRWRHGAWQMAGIYNWHTGWPYTPLLVSAQSWTDPVAVTLQPGARNSLRQRSFQSVDLRIAWTHPLLRGDLEASFELRNAFNEDNECCRDYQVVRVDGISTLLQSPRSWLPIAPILGVRWRLR